LHRLIAQYRVRSADDAAVLISGNNMSSPANEKPAISGDSGVMRLNVS
jgi:hypothetical protein